MLAQQHWSDRCHTICLLVAELDHEICCLYKMGLLTLRLGLKWCRLLRKGSADCICTLLELGPDQQSCKQTKQKVVCPTAKMEAKASYNTWPSNTADEYLDPTQVHSVVTASVRNIEASWQALHLVPMPP